MGNSNDFDNTQPLDPQTEALRAMISSLLEEYLRPFQEQLARVETEENAKARYVDLRARLARLQESMDILNDKFDAQAGEVNYLRKSVRLLEDKIDPSPLS